MVESTSFSPEQNMGLLTPEQICTNFDKKNIHMQKTNVIFRSNCNKHLKLIEALTIKKSMIQSLITATMNTVKIYRPYLGIKISASYPPLTTLRQNLQQHNQNPLKWQIDQPKVIEMHNHLDNFYTKSKKKKEISCSQPRKILTRSTLSVNSNETCEQMHRY